MNSIEETIMQSARETCEMPALEAAGALIRTLVQREDELADQLRMAAATFGLYPEIVAKTLADLNVGTPVTDEARLLIDTQFIALMERLQREHNERGGQ